MISKYDAITFDFKVFVILCAIALEENIIGRIPVTEMVTKQSLLILVYPFIHCIHFTFVVEDILCCSDTK